MCRTLKCFVHMQGHGAGSIPDLLKMLMEMHGAEPKEQSYEEALQAAIADQEMALRITEGVLGILKKEPPQEGAKIAEIRAFQPIDPTKHGFATIVTYELVSGAFLVVGTDHLTQDTISHTTPNVHGLTGMVKATLHELAKNSMAAADADKAKDGTPVH